MQQDVTDSAFAALADPVRRAIVARLSTGPATVNELAAPFDITHHPAMSLPCGMVDGLPVGLMLIGKHFDEMTIYRAAHAFEQSGDWKKM